MASDQPGLFGALLIALAGGWSASRILHSPARPFQALAIGLAGALLGMMLSGALHLELNAVGLLIAALAGGLAVLGAWRFVSHRVALRRNRGEPGEFPHRDKLEDPS